MNQIQDKFQAIINTIQTLDIKADYDTMNKLLGILQLLGSMKQESVNWIAAKPEPAPEFHEVSDEEEPEVEIIEE